MLNKISKLFTAILVISILSLGLLMVITAFPISGNIKAYVVGSGSMEPAIQVGSLIFVKPLSNYAVGDIITFGTKNRMPTTHRIVNTNEKGNFITQGDANDTVDGGTVTKDKVIGKVFLSAPYIGYIVDLAKQPIGFWLLIVLPAAILIFDEIKNIWIELKKMNKSKTQELWKN